MQIKTILCLLCVPARSCSKTWSFQGNTCLESSSSVQLSQTQLFSIQLSSQLWKITTARLYVLGRYSYSHILLHFLAFLHTLFCSLSSVWYKYCLPPWANGSSSFCQCFSCLQINNPLWFLTLYNSQLISTFIHILTIKPFAYWTLWNDTAIVFFFFIFIYFFSRGI